MNNDNKIGILTLHSGYNEGAILQAFCLAFNLQNNVTGKVEIVDHRYPSKERAYGPVRDEKTRRLDDFINHSLPLSTKRFIADDYQTTFKFIRENYSAIVIGSDELWKLKYTKRCFGLISEQNDLWCPAFPNVYWPDESIEIPKIAYAVSIGQTDWRTIPKKHITRMKRILSRYILLGIRDQRTMSFLKWLDPVIASKAEWVPDPTFATDILSLVDKKVLKQKLQQWGVDFSRPLICIVLKDTPHINEIIGEMKKKGFQIVGLTLPNRVADVDLSDKGFTPLEWFGVFGLMDFCISQRMHACISCILQDTPFIAVDFYSNPMDDDSKLKDLMQSFGLLDYYYKADNSSVGEFQLICERLFNELWPVNEIAEKRRLFNNRSKEFTDKIKGILSN
jgi:hypothetical protein